MAYGVCVSRTARIRAESFLATVPPQTRPMVKAEVEDMLRGTHLDAAGVWTVDYVRLRFVALKPPEVRP
jgi:hypothetical protein